MSVMRNIEVSCVAGLYRYPVKGLSGESLREAEVMAAGTLPQDRRYGIVHASSQVALESPCWMKKDHFLHLARDEKLGELRAIYSDNAQRLALLRRGRQIVCGDLQTSRGRMVLEGFLSSFMPGGARGYARIVEAGESGHFADNAAPYLSLINRATVQDVTRVVRSEVSPGRFRGNILIENVPPWCEYQWIGKNLRIGELLCVVEKRITRCNAVNVDPDSGAVTMNIPLALQRGFRHSDCGVFLRVLEGGTVRVDDRLEVCDDT